MVKSGQTGRGMGGAMKPLKAGVVPKGGMKMAKGGKMPVSLGPIKAPMGQPGRKGRVK